jgi:hypothetical protein
MAERQSIIGGGVTDAVRRIFDRFRSRPHNEKPELPGADDHDAYTLFEGMDLRVHDLSASRLEDMQFDPGLLPGAFRIRVARTRDTSNEASGLVRKRYASRGYLVPGAKPDPNLFTFVAYNSGDLVGTVSLRLDSTRGLSADELYKAEIDGLRNGTTRICEFTRLAIDVNAGSKWVLAGLFHTAYLFAHRVSGRDAAVIEVNPRHVVFYERALAFQKIGPERISPRVNAPAVLLCVQFKMIAEGLAKYASKPETTSSTRSLFPYGFSAKDEEGILARLQEFDKTTQTRGIA